VVGEVRVGRLGDLQLVDELEEVTLATQPALPIRNFQGRRAREWPDSRLTAVGVVVHPLVVGARVAAALAAAIGRVDRAVAVGARVLLDRGAVGGAGIVLNVVAAAADEVAGEEGDLEDRHEQNHLLQPIQTHFFLLFLLRQAGLPSFHR